MSRFNLSALAVRERSITLFAIILISIAGVLAFVRLGRAEDPGFTVKAMTVITAWPGATAQEMQDLVAEPLEKRLQGCAGTTVPRRSRARGWRSRSCSFATIRHRRRFKTSSTRRGRKSATKRAISRPASSAR